MASMTDVMKFFGMKAGEFRNEWAQLTEADKEELKAELDKLNAQ